MRRILLFGASLLTALYSAQAAAEADRCGGVLMANRTLGTRDHKASVQKLGFYMIDGGLVMNGKSTCTSIHIECERATNVCRTATAVTKESFGRGQVLGVFMSEDYKVTDWSNETIRAEMHPAIGGTSYLHILVNDEIPDKVELINIVQSFIAKPGEWVTEVMTVEFDPAVIELLKKPN